jgi:bifunctional non-homologous end joining protein LigD
VKWDGYRALAVKDGARVQLVSRNQKELTRDYSAIVAALHELKASSFVLDGEIVALDAEGRLSFQALQHRRTSALAVVYYAFDLLELNGEYLIATPLEERRRTFSMAGSGSPRWFRRLRHHRCLRVGGRGLEHLLGHAR